MLFDDEVSGHGTDVEPCGMSLFGAYVAHSGPNDVYPFMAGALAIFRLSFCAFG